MKTNGARSSPERLGARLGASGAVPNQHQPPPPGQRGDRAQPSTPPAPSSRLRRGQRPGARRGRARPAISSPVIRPRPGLDQPPQTWARPAPPRPSAAALRESEGGTPGARGRGMRSAPLLTSGWRRGTQPASASYSSGPSAILVLNPSARCMPGESVPLRGARGRRRASGGASASPAGGDATASLSGPCPPDAPSAPAPRRARVPARARDRAARAGARSAALHCAGRAGRPGRGQRGWGRAPGRGGGAPPVAGRRHRRATESQSGEPSGGGAAGTALEPRRRGGGPGSRGGPGPQTPCPASGPSGPPPRRPRRTWDRFRVWECPAGIQTRVAVETKGSPPSSTLPKGHPNVRPPAKTPRLEASSWRSV